MRQNLVHFNFTVVISWLKGAARIHFVTETRNNMKNTLISSEQIFGSKQDLQS